MIEKPSIIITSLGRTGTLFFAKLFDDIVTDGTSLHEPDYFNFGQYQGPKEKFGQAVRQIRESGFHNLVIRKALGRWSVRAISDARVRRQLDRRDAANQILDQREGFIHSREGSIYVESSSAFYGVLDVLPDVFSDYRVVYVVRDGRDWIRSVLNFTAAVMYDRSWLRTLISPDWPTAIELEDEPFSIQWPTMTAFERLCWAWARLNEYALDSMRGDPRARVFRFKDIFRRERRYEHLEELVRFAISFDDEGPEELDLDGVLDRKVHGSASDFPRWEDWPPERKRRYREICGPLMKRLGYELD